jgi:hypothetical protein
VILFVTACSRPACPIRALVVRYPAMASAVADMRDTAAIEHDLACLPGPRGETAWPKNASPSPAANTHNTAADVPRMR